MPSSTHFAYLAPVTQKESMAVEVVECALAAAVSLLSPPIKVDCVLSRHDEVTVGEAEGVAASGPALGRWWETVGACLVSGVVVVGLGFVESRVEEVGN
ncbi:hypothetical protein FJTKL_02037 [Diaporthe vaccinii]|uniref:Uncharacterized protein n=1 Tax=Diaporthe vaccinii TaxID=105482 RepID=A0ABR4DZ88_9PEZI